MDNPTILYEAIRMHYREISEESASWRMANQAKITRQGLIIRFLNASVTYLKKMVAHRKQEQYAADPNLSILG